MEKLVSDIYEPVPMLPGQIAVLMRPFETEPETEFHAKGTHIVCQRLQSIGKLILVDDFPVARSQTPEGARTASDEPTRIEHKVIDVEISHPVSQLLEKSLVDLSADAEPMVVTYGGEGTFSIEIGTNFIVEISSYGVGTVDEIAFEKDDVNPR
jgi:hypothetical protein